jgi:heme/copper-type cytochrome/quinol oxidase subunit 1
MRRIYNPMQYEFIQPMQDWNVFITVTALTLGLSQIIFLVNFFASLFRWNAKWFRLLVQIVVSAISGYALQMFIGLALFLLVGASLPLAAALIAGVALAAIVFWYLYRKMGELGETAPRNPWQANTLEWIAASPPPHGNFEVQPVVYRGPYEYSSPEVKEDWLPQNKPLGAAAAARAH